MNKFLDVSGQQFNRLLALWSVGKDKHHHYLFACQCSCGTVIVATSNNLRSGSSQSCGCLRRENATKENTIHGHAKKRTHSRTYDSWRCMIYRCTNPKSIAWRSYGGANPPVRVAKRWLKFPNFLADMGERPIGTTLGRFLDTGDYKKSNCQWQSPERQRLEHQHKAATKAAEFIAEAIAEVIAEVIALRKGAAMPEMIAAA